MIQLISTHESRTCFSRDKVPKWDTRALGSQNHSKMYCIASEVQSSESCCQDTTHKITGTKNKQQKQKNVNPNADQLSQDESEQHKAIALVIHVVAAPYFLVSSSNGRLQSHDGKKLHLYPLHSEREK